MLFGASGVLLVGLVTVWLSRPVKRYVVRRGTDPQRPWIVFDRHLNVTHSDWVLKQAAKNRAYVANNRKENL
jgi:riboflavin biosynthesis pyrimidine reductase